MPTSPNNQHLPFGENKNAEWYGKDILSVKQFSRTGPRIRVRRGA